MKLYKYTFRSPLSGSISCEELFPDTDGRMELDSSDMANLYVMDSRLAEFLNNNREDVSEYVSDYIQEFVHKVELGDYAMLDGQLYLLSHVWSDKQLKVSEVSDVQEWIAGQLSDGWGESLEQREWRDERVYFEKPHFDTIEGIWDKEECYERACFYVTPWKIRLSVELHDMVIEEVADPEPDTKEETLKQVGDRLAQIVEMLNKII